MTQGCQSFFPNFSRFLKLHISGSIFSLKLSLRLKRLKRNHKVTLNVFLIKNIYKAALLYLLNDFILFNAVLSLNLTLN